MKPHNVYRALKDQLGSIREVYLPPKDIEPLRNFPSNKEIVLLLHGFFQTRNIWEVMERRLRYDGFSVMSFNMRGSFSRLNTKPIDVLAQLLADKIERLAAKHQFEQLHIIGHSKGGIIARRYIQHFGGKKRAKSLITLGSPHYGTPTALAGLALLTISKNPRELLPGSSIVRAMNRDPFPSSVPFTSIYSKHDVICPYWCSKLRPRTGEVSLENFPIDGIGHSELTWDSEVYQAIRTRLQRSQPSSSV